MHEWGAAVGWREHAPWGKIAVQDRAAIPEGACYGVYSACGREADPVGLAALQYEEGCLGRPGLPGLGATGLRARRPLP